MLNILLPSMGTSAFFKESFFPKPLVEINGKTMLETVIENYRTIKQKKYIFIFQEKDCQEFHLDGSVQLLETESIVIRLQNQTAGALCTCLMAVEAIGNQDPLIIANSDQIIDVDYARVLQHFEQMAADAGIITFPSIHPRWSYAKKEQDEIVEVAEKRPLSQNAIAGFYYFKRGADFITAAQNALLKRSHLDGKYYISATINEMILLGRRVGFYDIAKEQYHSFYSPAKIKEYEEAKRS